jgi:rare lipoprotein A
MQPRAWEDLIAAEVAGRYVLRAVLAAGRYQAEFLAVTAGPEAAERSLTLVEPAPGAVEQEREQMAAARRLQHPNLLSILDCGRCTVRQMEFLYVVTERAGRTLAQTVAAAPLPEAEARSLLENLLDGLAYVHSQGLVYRALEAETVVRSGGGWRLGDLGELHQPGQFDAATAVNPARPRSTPPEAAAGWIRPSGDLWALGALLQDVLASRTSIPAPFEAVIRGCRERDPEKRMTIAQIRDLLSPPPAPQAPERALVPPSFRRRNIAVAGAIAVATSLVLLVLVSRPHRSAPPPPPPVRKVSKLPVITPPVANRPSPFPTRSPAGTPATVPSRPIAAPPSTEPRVAAGGPAPADPESGDTPDGQHWEIGQADYLSDAMEGRPTASGEPFSSQSLSAAHRRLPLGTRLRVTNLANQRSVVVRVNDRGGFRRGFVVSVTRSVAEQLGFVAAGSARVRIETLP